jgi:PAS domain S-box-containing protein
MTSLFMNLSWLVLFIFFGGFLASASMAGQPGPDGSGWMAAMLLSALGLCWTGFGELLNRRQTRDIPVSGAEGFQAVERFQAQANDAGAVAEEPAPAPLFTAPTPRVAAMTATASPFEEYFERAPLPMVVINREGCVVRMNQAAESVTEFAAAEVRAEAYWDVFLTEAAAPDAAAHFRDDMLARRAPIRREAWKTRTGAAAHFEWWRTLLKDEFGQSAGVLAAGMPVAEAAAPVNLTALVDQLTTVNGYSEWLLMSIGNEDPIRHDLESIHRAGVAAQNCIEVRA